MTIDLVQGEKGLYELRGRWQWVFLRRQKGPGVSSRDTVAGQPGLTPQPQTHRLYSLSKMFHAYSSLLCQEHRDNIITMLH